MEPHHNPPLVVVEALVVVAMVAAAIVMVIVVMVVVMVVVVIVVVVVVAWKTLRRGAGRDWWSSRKDCAGAWNVRSENLDLLGMPWMCPGDWSMDGAMATRGGLGIRWIDFVGLLVGGN